MFTKKLLAALGVIVTILSLIGGIWAFDVHYATDEKVDNLEIQIAGALQNVQIKSDYKFYQFMYDKLTQDMYRIRRLIRANPSDQNLKMDYQEVVKQRTEMKGKMDELMRKIN